MPIQDRAWYTITEGVDRQPLKHVFLENEIASALHVYRQVRRDLPYGYRIGLCRIVPTRSSSGNQYEGQLWKGGLLLVQASGWSIRLLLAELRARSAELDQPVEW